QNPYSKRHLVPFGEYIPFKKSLEKIIPSMKDFQLMGELDPGDGFYLQKTEHGKIGGIICFESIFPSIVRGSVNEGAELIILVSNDSWFKDSSAVYQHHKQAIMRAVENNRYIVRAANTGISSFIDNKGRVIEETELLKEEVVNSKVSMISDRSIYSVVGDIIVLFGVLWIGIIYVRKKLVN
ncbi:MAG: apolipoprotein N-acyltransferase, partial [Bacilli bacterium]